MDVDRYRIDRALRQVMISAREVDSRNLDASAQTWVNLYLAYTHGYGVVAAQVNRAGTRVGPTLSSAASISSRRPSRSASRVSTSGSPHRTRPPTWWSASTGGGRQPVGERPGQASFRYDGLGGVQLSSPLRRLAAALHFTDLNLLISSNLDGRSRILFNRDIRDRVEKAALFPQWDADLYVAVVDGRIVFIRDGYTVTDNYPYSQRIPLDVAARRTDLEDQGVHGEANYIRNSVKAVVDAYDGTTTLYARRDRPAAADLAQGVPKPVRAPLGADPRAAGAPALSGGPVLHPDRPVRLLPYRRCARLLLQAGLLGPPRGPLGPTHPRRGHARGGRPQAPDAALLPALASSLGERDEQFVLVMPFTLNNKQNMVAYMAGSADPTDYGTITLFSLPRARTVFGPTQIHAQILADPEVSKELTLFNQQGSTVIFGNLLTVPIKDSLLYVQPIFVQASQGDPGTAAGPGVLQQPARYTATLTDSIDQVLDRTARAPPTDGRQPPAPPQTSSTALARILQQEAEEYQRAQQALDRHDLGAYQKAIERLGLLIQQAQRLTEAPSPSTTAQGQARPDHDQHGSGTLEPALAGHGPSGHRGRC